MRRLHRAAAVVALVLLAAGLTTVEAQYKYRYGGYGSSTSESGWYVSLEVGVANPRNTDVVVAVTRSSQDFGGGINVTNQIVPNWDDDASGRLAVGYAFSGGNRVEASFWSFDTDTSAAGSGPGGGTTFFTVGPPIFTAGDYVGDAGSPGSYGIGVKVEASTADVAWARSHAMTDKLTLEWSLGLRYAKFEETVEGSYDEAAIGGGSYGQNRFAVYRDNTGEMVGARAAVRGTMKLTHKVSARGTLGFSMLDGKIDALSTMTPTGSANASTTPSSYVALSDDSRSGSMRDIEAALIWAPGAGRVKLWFGWEQSLWEQIASDQVRNLPGTAAPVRDRNSVTFSGYKLGVSYTF